MQSYPICRYSCPAADSPKYLRDMAISIEQARRAACISHLASTFTRLSPGRCNLITGAPLLTAMKVYPSTPRGASSHLEVAIQYSGQCSFTSPHDNDYPGSPEDQTTLRIQRSAFVEIPSAMNSDQLLLATETNETDENAHAAVDGERRLQADTQATTSYMAPCGSTKLLYTVGGVELDQDVDQDRDRDQRSQSTTFDKVKASPSDISRHYWTPFWLRRYTLIAFATLFALLAAALVILWYASKHQNGFSTTFGTNHYAWTYGPTAILVVVLSLWRQVE